jgi:hypothetical protein
MNAKVYGAAVVTERKQLRWPKPKRVGGARAPESFINLLYRPTEIIDRTAFDPDQPISWAKPSIADPHVDIAKQGWEREAKSSL